MNKIQTKSHTLPKCTSFVHSLFGLKIQQQKFPKKWGECWKEFICNRLILSWILNFMFLVQSTDNWYRGSRSMIIPLDPLFSWKKNLFKFIWNSLSLSNTQDAEESSCVFCITTSMTHVHVKWNAYTCC